MRDEFSKPVALGDHVAVQDGYHLRWAFFGDEVESMVQVRGFGMSLDQFAASAVSKVWILVFSKVFDVLLAGSRITIVKDDDTILAAGIVEIAGGCYCVHEKGELFAAGTNEDIDSGHTATMQQERTACLCSTQ